MNLRNLQQALQRHVVANDASIAAEIGRSGPFAPETRLAIYSEAYRLRLTDALAQNYPRLQQWLGAEVFDGIAHDYIRSHPSTRSSVRWFGDRLAELLAGHPACASQPWIAELARWEWAIASAFDAPDAEPVDERTIAAVAPEQWPAMRFALHGSTQLMLLHTNAAHIFRALGESAVPPGGESHEVPLQWLIWRARLVPRYRAIEADEASALRTVLAAGTFEQVCEALTDWHEATAAPLRAASLLKIWLNDGMLTGITTADPGP